MGRTAGGADDGARGGAGGGAGRLYTGTSGFAYPGWAPHFYPVGLPAGRLLSAYAARLSAVELHSTFYRRPTPAAVEAWLAATPRGFRFCPKAQRGSVLRSFRADGVKDALDWLTPSLALFGERLGPVLLSVPGTIRRDDRALDGLLEAWPAAMPLALELVHPSWEDDEVFDRLRERQVGLVASDRAAAPEPDLRRTGPSLYLRLRRQDYLPEDLRRWAARLRPFLEDGVDVYAFVRHDEVGRAALDAEALATLATGMDESEGSRE
jgi:uncharacterized protein YecE (DUF72 family)